MRRLLQLGLAVALLTGCGSGNDTAQPRTTNNPPRANAGADIEQSGDQVVSLDGSGSFDPDGDALKYHWTFEYLPETSGVDERLAPFTENHSAEAQATTFAPDVAGTYVVTLVVDDGWVNSAPDYVVVTITGQDDIPIANAGEDQSVKFGTVVNLNGNRSYDPAGHELSFQWGLVDVPAASHLTIDSLVGATTATPTFEPDAMGVYVANLVVSNGFASSTPDAVVVTVVGLNGPPVANAGEDFTGEDCTALMLDASGSVDPDGDALTYFWELQQKPAASGTSNADFSDRTAQTTTFWADTSGTYVFSVAVSDGTNWSVPDLHHHRHRGGHPRSRRRPVHLRLDRDRRRGHHQRPLQPRNDRGPVRGHARGARVVRAQRHHVPALGHRLPRLRRQRHRRDDGRLLRYQGRIGAPARRPAQAPCRAALIVAALCGACLRAPPSEPRGSEPRPESLPTEAGAARGAAIRQVPPTADLGIPPVQVDLRPLAALAAPCQDRRYPRLVGRWAVGCGPEGRVDRAVDLVTREVIELVEGARVPGAGPPGTLLALEERRARRWRLPTQVPEPIPTPCADLPIAPPALAGDEVAIVVRGRVVRFRAGESMARLEDAEPMPWYPPALAGGWMAWVDGRQRAVTGTDVWAWDGIGKPVPVAREPGNQRHVAGSGRWLGWIDDHGVVVEDLVSGERRTVRAASGFRAGLSLWGPVACWEDRAGGSVDVACSDGVAVRGDGDQGWPTRWGPWLLLRVDGEVRLATARSLVLEDDDPRAHGTGARAAGGHGGAHGEVAWTLDWPAAGWCVDRWVTGPDGGRWTPAGPLAVGEDVEIRHPQGDAVRLRPCGTEEA